ncbi:hypothetical protein [Chryseobacterium paludis]|uniref:hypothetical protein n=1 Tax=Chryseobacterium paludis TaxID=2956784 RepID=UPI0021BE24CF|nr:hypothetical protein [Chryseobacterium paludis]
MKKETLRQLRSDYESREIKPSRDLWDRIDHGMGETSDLPLKQSVQWWKYAAVVLLLISCGIYFYFDSKQVENTVLVTKSDKPDKTSTVEKEDDKFNRLEAEEVKHKNVAISDKRNAAEIKSEKAIIKTYPEEFKSYNPILVKAKEEKNTETLVNIPTVKEKAHDQIVEKPIVIAQKKKANYINADELLLGREFDKTREENHNEHKKMGVVDMDKIKIKGPNSFKILGLTVFSDSSGTK